MWWIICEKVEVRTTKKHSNECQDFHFYTRWSTNVMYLVVCLYFTYIFHVFFFIIAVAQHLRIFWCTYKCPLISLVLQSHQSILSFKDNTGTLILSYLDPLAALVLKFGHLWQWAAKWEQLALNLSCFIHYHDKWQTTPRTTQIHVDPLNLNKVERQSGCGSTKQSGVCPRWTRTSC